MSVLSASSYVASVDLVPIDMLVDQGIKLVLLDRDNTCVPRDAVTAPKEIFAWFGRAKAAGLTLCLVSNNIHLDQVRRSARELGIEGVGFAMKPLPVAIFSALRRFGVAKREAVFIGDQLFTDIAAGNLAGIKTILVRPQSEVDLWYTKLLRRVENAVLDQTKFEGEE